MYTVDTGPNPSPASFHRVQDALASAKTGDRILIRGEVLRETWAGAAKSQFAKGVTIEGDVPPGQYVTWKFTPHSNLDNYVLNLESVEGLVTGQGRSHGLAAAIVRSVNIDGKKRSGDWCCSGSRNKHQCACR